MKRRPLFLFAAALLTLFTVSTLRAQTNYVGSNSSGVSSNFTSGTNSYSATIVGYDVGANSNILVVENTNTVLTNSGVLRVGESGSSNSMVISNGGKVQNTGGIIGNSNTAVNNSVLVTGTDSLWMISTPLRVGALGSGNSLVISNGGKVENGGGIIGATPSASNNSVLVTGAESRWVNTNNATVGALGSGNSLVISNGGVVQNISGLISATPSASNNSVLVTGAGSTWSNSTTLSNGVNGRGTLTVANGGSVAATDIAIASAISASGTLNIGRFGTNDTAGTINAQTITFGNGTGVINFNQSDSTTLSAAISALTPTGTRSVNQLGSGTTILSASNSYTGATTVGGGLLVVNGSIANSTVTVQSGGMLGGSGTVGAVIVQSGGTINPGNSPGTLNINGDIDWLGGGNYNWQIAGVTGTAGTVSTWDLVSATGVLDLTALNIGSKFNINLWSLSSTGPDVNGAVPGFDNTQNYTWKIATAAGGITGFNSSYFNLNTGANNGTGGFANGLNGGSFSLAQSGNDLNLVFTAAGGPGPSPVPEPGTWAAAALLAAGAGFMRWRKRAKVA
jgi:T5SS/PEP-CTERM-associated repeat protein